MNSKNEGKPKIYILHPYRGAGRPGERKQNLDQIEAIALYILKVGGVPISPIHCLGFLNDEHPDQRELGLQLCETFIEIADLVWAYVLPPGQGAWERSQQPPATWPSPGCERDHAIARQLGKRITYLEYAPVAICQTRGAGV